MKIRIVRGNKSSFSTDPMWLITSGFVLLCVAGLISILAPLMVVVFSILGLILMIVGGVGYLVVRMK